MSTSTDFSAWLKNNEPRNQEEWNCLYQGCLRRRTRGPYRVTTHGAQTFVKGRANKLAVVTETTRMALVRLVLKESMVAPSPLFPNGPGSWD
jgi:hypothetical protein